MHAELTRQIAVAVKNDRWKIYWIWITPFEGLTRFKARSVQSVESYLVDLEFYWGVGKCGCKWFATHLEPTVCRWMAEERDISDDWRCKHLIAARQYLGDDLVRKQLEVLKRKDTTRTTRLEYVKHH
jgi:hypothetical protein